jgi:hypothetical protein
MFKKDPRMHLIYLFTTPILAIVKLQSTENHHLKSYMSNDFLTLEYSSKMLKDELISYYYSPIDRKE